MKILFLNHNLIWRGTFFRCFGFARELVKLGHEVDLWTVSREPSLWGQRYLEDGVRIWRTPRWGRVGRHDGGYAPIDNLSRLLQSSVGSWDVVHAFDHRPNVLLPWLWLRFRSRLFRRNSPPLFMSDWCDWWTAGGIVSSRRPFAMLDRAEQLVEEGSKKISDGVSVIGSVLYGRARKAGIEDERLLLLPSGVSVERFPLLDQLDCRRRLDLPLDAPIFGFIGFSLWDMELLAQAFSRIKCQLPAARLLVIGGGVEEKAKNLFRERFTLGQDLYLPGVIPFSEAPFYLGACDIQLLPMENTIANRARVPNKLFDYFASGRPVIVSNVGDAGQMVHEGQTGVAVEEGADAFARAAVQTLEDQSFAQDCGERARRLAETNYAYANLTRTLLAFYEKMM